MRLNKAMYGLVQAARMWTKRKALIMKKLGFYRSKTYPWLYIKDLKSGEQIYVLVYVDDCIAVGLKQESEIFVNVIGDLLKIIGA